MYSLIGGIKVKIGSLQFNKVFSCKIKKTTRLLSNTATIELPLSAVLENTKRLTIANEIKRGDKVEISLGYDKTLREEFTGFIQSISDMEKLVIECEDKMFLLRKPLKDKVFAKTTLKEVVNYIISGSDIELNSDIPEINFESFALKNVTAIQALQKIKDNYGLMVYLDNDNKLYVGLSYTYDSGKVTYSLQKNVQDNKLTFKHTDELKYKIKAISLLKNNKKIEVEAGDSDGELRTLHFRNITDEKKLKELALQEIEKYKYTGYRGTLTAWGLPYCTFGMSATIRDNNYPAREGSYYVEGVVVTFGDGITREIELGVKL
jgi:hypothetical protein